ncbi:hypothetical protein [Pectinatus brassicae]|uniref:Uncharacterized protein n=1 Tax=Pectinatus brassicae TaxID=862415 RepID=A0A840UT45_9FIRM|nr:hypothetical protein [Pectinatus brassicae]MBB5336133.1 hypothetical protein [Pectinatus brassicae]
MNKLSYIARMDLIGPRVYTIYSSQGAYFIYNDFCHVVETIKSLSDSYYIKVEIMESQEEAWRYLQAVNISKQIKDNYSKEWDKIINSLPCLEQMPYGAMGAGSPNKLLTVNSCYVMVTSNYQYFCTRSINELSNMLFVCGPEISAEIRMVDDEVMASKMIISKDVFRQTLSGNNPELLPPVQNDKNYGVQGFDNNSCKNLVK